MKIYDSLGEKKTKHEGPSLTPPPNLTLSEFKSSSYLLVNFAYEKLLKRLNFDCENSLNNS